MSWMALIRIGTAARLAPPRDVEVVLRLVAEPQPVGGDHAPDAAAGDDLGGLAHDRVVAAMMSGQDRDIGLLAGLDQFERFGDGVRDRLLDDDRDLARDAGEPDLYVHLVRHRDDGAVRLDAIEHLLDPGVDRIAERLSFGGSRGRRIGDRRQRVVGIARAKHADVRAADEAGSDHRNAHLRHFFLR